MSSVDRRAEEDDPLVQQARVDVERALAARRLLDHHRDQRAHRRRVYRSRNPARPDGERRRACGERHGVDPVEVGQSPSVAAPETRYATCPLCEATCGLEFDVEDDRSTRIRGDEDDVFSNGFICPKGAALERPRTTTPTGCARR